MTADARRAVARLIEDLQSIVGPRLRAVVVYGAHAGSGGHAAPREAVHALAIVEQPGFADLEACAARVGAWARHGLDTPLLLGAEEFRRSLDAFPFEFGAILAQYEVAHGSDPFDGLQVDRADLRRACEIQARSHLLHLREGYLETRGEPRAIADLVARSAAPLHALLASLARVDGADIGGAADLAAHAARQAGVPRETLAAVLEFGGGSMQATDAARLFPEYLNAVERVTAYVDRWTGAR